MKVCIAEKPSVAGEIAKVLGARARKDGYFEGNGYQVTWTFGHLCTLKMPGEYYADWKKWSLSNLPMIPPRYEVRLIDDAGIRKQFKIIKELYKHADVIINCGDAGQEGELIQRWVMELAGARCPVQRLWISSLTEEAIREGFQNLVPQSKYDRLYAAGKARAEGDWLLGMNCSQLYTMKYAGYGQTLSVGRVQTPTLAMIVDRDQQIEHFKPEPYWVLTTKYRGALFSSSMGHMKTQAEGLQLLQRVKGAMFTITDVKQKQGREAPPQLYDLTSLQVDCNKKFGMSADKTLSTIQSLYEKKLTTYPRVDTKYLPDDVYPKIRSILGNLKGYEQYVEPFVHGSQIPKSRRVFDNSKVTDHHAIIPTGDNSRLNDINSYEQKVYDLIVRRFLAVFYPDCEYATTTVMGRAADVDFKASGKTILNPGWRYIYNKVETDEEEKEPSPEGENATLPKFTNGEHGSHFPELTQKMTTPPKRYTEATLLQAMETAGKFVDDETLREAMKENGIGRPSSRASIIETLLKRQYIRREKKNLISTPTGRDLIRIIEARMLKSPELTGQWEKKLRDIEKGSFTLEAFMEELQAQLVSIIQNVTGDATGRRVAVEAKPVPSTRSSSSSKSYSSSKTRKPSAKRVVPVYSNKEAKEGDKCPICGKGIVRKGPYGLFCSEYKTTGCRLKNK